MSPDKDLSAPKVAIIILNWNNSSDTLACLDSLEKLDYPAFTTLVIDNGSVDDSTAVIRRAYPAVNLIEAGQNLGFVGGNNLGLETARKAGAVYALLLNNDTEVAPDFLTHLVGAAETCPQAAFLGPNLYYFDQPGTLWSAGGKIDWRRGLTSMVGLNQEDQGQFGERPREVDFVTGCALLARMSVVQQIGPLDPRFFAYYEEVEWCVRARRAGYTIVHVPQARVWHKISIIAREASPMVHYYMTRNRLLFLRLSGASLVSWLSTLFEYGRTLFSWTVKPRWRGKSPQRDAMLRAILDYGRSRFGKMEVSSRA